MKWRVISTDYQLEFELVPVEYDSKLETYLYFIVINNKIIEF
jgi:hypothetical protein